MAGASAQGPPGTGSVPPSQQVAPVARGRTGPDAQPLLFTALVNLDGNVSDGTQRQISQAMQTFANNLASKMQEVERDQRSPGVDNAEYTASTVIRATEELKRRPGGTRPSNLDISVRLIAPISSGAAGILGTYLHSIWQAGLFGFVVCIAIVTTVAIVIKAQVR
jgi:hypothetical protein